MKICRSCQKKLEEKDFRPKRNDCKKCEKEKIKIWRKNNQEHIKEYNKNYFQKHKDKIVESKREYLHEYRQTEKYKKHKKEYAKKNRKKTNLQTKERLNNDVVFKLKHQTRNLINKCFRKKYKSSEKTEEIIGCKLDYFIDYLLQTFKNNYGYNWNKKELVHIDHIIPLSTAKTKDETIKLCHYSNLQLLKAKDNLKKSNKMVYKI